MKQSTRRTLRDICESAAKVLIGIAGLIGFFGGDVIRLTSHTNYLLAAFEGWLVAVPFLFLAAVAESLKDNFEEDPVFLEGKPTKGPLSLNLADRSK